MKKIFIIFFTLLFFSAYIFAAEYPRWMTLPIYVYVPENGQMSKLMKQAFTAWETKSHGIVRFKFVQRQDDANIEVEFVDFVANCNDIHAVGCTEITYRSRGNIKDYRKAYITIGTKEYIRKQENGRYIRELTTRPKENIYGVMLHEVGHSIGLGHSQNSNSIMYMYDLPTMQYLTDEDMKLLYNKYH